MSSAILVVDDDREMCELLKESLDRRGYEVTCRLRGDEALELVRDRDFDAVLLDVNLGQMNGIDLCRTLSENRPDLAIIVITAFGNMASAIAALHAGACDFVNKPIDFGALAESIERALRQRGLREKVRRLHQEPVMNGQALGRLSGKSPGMLEMYDLIARVADTDTTVLLTGESGTGKELVARALHEQGRRSQAPFVAINCAAVPAALLEAELFGHVKGAFTDATTGRRGLFDQAGTGTLLLDEIGEMPLEMQPKLLRVLQERQFRPVGGNEVMPMQARIIAATNRDLEREVAGARFREDLFYRLNVVQIQIPPLRARGEDILLLASEFVSKAAARMNKPVNGISVAAAQRLLEYDWPGNVRQLENTMERAVALTRTPQIALEDLPERILRYEGSRVSLGPLNLEQTLTLDELEKNYIERALRVAKGNKTQAAKTLGVDRRTLYRKLDRYNAAAARARHSSPENPT